MNWWLTLGYSFLGFGTALAVDSFVKAVVVYACFVAALNILIDQLA